MKTINFVLGLFFLILFLFTQDLFDAIIGCAFLIYVKIDQAKEEIIKTIESKQNEN